MSESEADDGRSQQLLLEAICALLADIRESVVAEGAMKTELVLSRVGLTYQAIAPLVGKNPDAVRKTISRARE
jgi:DNA-directed RNA polymerase specialized sigma24 family protein